MTATDNCVRLAEENAELKEQLEKASADLRDAKKKIAAYRKRDATVLASIRHLRAMGKSFNRKLAKANKIW